MVQLQRLIDYLYNEVFNIQLSQLIFQELVQFAYILCTGLSQERAEAQKAKTFRIAFFLRAKTFCAENIFTRAALKKRTHEGTREDKH